MKLSNSEEAAGGNRHDPPPPSLHRNPRRSRKIEHKVIKIFGRYSTLADRAQPPDRVPTADTYHAL